MPIYTYSCPSCEQAFRTEKSMTDPHPEVCPLCNYQGEFGRVFDVPGITFRGSGFYHTDKALDEIVPEYHLNLEQQTEYYDEKLRHGDDRKIKVFT